MQEISYNGRDDLCLSLPAAFYNAEQRKEKNPSVLFHLIAPLFEFYVFELAGASDYNTLCCI